VIGYCDNKTSVVCHGESARRFVPIANTSQVAPCNVQARLLTVSIRLAAAHEEAIESFVAVTFH
jgi:hypothetical protein